MCVGMGVGGEGGDVWLYPLAMNKSSCVCVYSCTGEIGGRGRGEGGTGCVCLQLREVHAGWRGGGGEVTVVSSSHPVPLLPQLCFKGFKLSSQLNEHLAVHQATNAAGSSGLGGKRRGKSAPGHRCTVCNKVFQKPSQVERHMRIHTGEWEQVGTWEGGLVCGWPADVLRCRFSGHDLTPGLGRLKDHFSVVFQVSSCRDSSVSSCAQYLVRSTPK